MKILLIHPFGIGDVIFSLAAAEALARRGHEISYLCNERTEEFLALCPVVRKTHRFDRAELRGMLQSGRWVKAAARYAALRRTIADERYDAVLDFSMGREYAFLAWCAGIRRRVGWDYKRRGRWLTDRIRVEGFDDRSPRDYAMDLARILNPGVGTEPFYPDFGLGNGEKTPASDSEMPASGRAAALADEKSWLLRTLGQDPWIVVAPGGGESWGSDAHFKQWPKDSWIELTRLLSRDTGLKIVVLGSQAEEALVHAVADSADPHSAAGATAVVGQSLRRVLALLAGARAFVGSDGGLLHLANLVATPVVGLYGPVSEQGYGPLESAGTFHVVTAAVPCRPCYKQFRFTGCAFDKRCLTEIQADRVAWEVRSLLARERS